jgi:hypothetical protein
MEDALLIIAGYFDTTSENILALLNKNFHKIDFQYSKNLDKYF